MASSTANRLDAVTLRDERRLAKRIAGAAKIADPQRRAGVEAEIDAAIAEAQATYQRRSDQPIKLVYPPELPITERRDEILETIDANPVVIIAGETGSGKSTQLPKFCLELGRGRRGQIAHTQPRRIAARSIASRLSEETETAPGATIGYAVRFDDRTGPDTLVKVMTDGILLAEIQHDPYLWAYDTIIIDEAHERSLNIDFLLGYLKRVLGRRDDLRVIITSATIDTERFAQHFDNAPIIEVSGRSYPVTIRYEPPEPDTDLATAIADAVGSLLREGPGDILVFNAGEAQITDAANAIRKRHYPGLEVLPLYGRLSAAEQHRIFEAHSTRRVVLATNVAETSLTVPGIRSVIDPGQARISRYSTRTKVQRLPIEAISQASANQRAGRCGRLGPGVCVRLFDEEDFEARPAFTEPEIRRTNLASVILAMASLGLGDPAEFPFVDPPEPKAITDGIALLDELGALKATRRRGDLQLTSVGKTLSRLPVDPRLGRMIIEAEQHGCVREVAIIVAALSIQDPRERPQSNRDQADAAHAERADPDSDFLSWLVLWEWLDELRASTTRNQFRRRCQRSYLHYQRTREWRDVYRQTMGVLDDAGIKRTSLGTDADPEPIHRSILAGLLSNIGVRVADSKEYRGARNTRFVIGRGSALDGRTPDWVMAAELVETSRLFARQVARIEPEWVEAIGGHIIKRTHGDPLWSRVNAQAVAEERVSIYGVPVVADRAVAYASIDPSVARSMFIYHALIEHDWDARFDFMDHNDQVIAEVRSLHARDRSHDLFAEQEALERFFAQRLPADICAGDAFERWWRRKRKKQPRYLNLRQEDLVDRADLDLDPALFPDHWELDGGVSLPIRYEFDPTSPTDGVTVQIPVRLLPQLSDADFAWGVPGLRADLLEALVRNLPKATRRAFVPIPDTVAHLLASVGPDDGPLVPVVRDALARRGGVPVTSEDLRLDAVDDHLRVTYEVIDEDTGDVVGHGMSLPELQTRLAPDVRASIGADAKQLEANDVTRWDFGPLPQRVELATPQGETYGYPALIDAGDSVAIRVLPTKGDQRRAMRRGTRRLLRLNVGAPIKTLRPLFTPKLDRAIAASPHQTKKVWVEDCIWATIDDLVHDAGGPAWNRNDFAELAEAVRSGFADRLESVARDAAAVTSAAATAHEWIEVRTGTMFGGAATDEAEHYDRLVYPWQFSSVGAHRLGDIARYLEAISVRLERIPERQARDAEWMHTCRDLDRQYWNRVDHVAASPAVEAVAWQLEELRVALFAQHLGVATKVSPKRVQRAIDALH